MTEKDDKIQRPDKLNASDTKLWEEITHNILPLKNKSKLIKNTSSSIPPKAISTKPSKEVKSANNIEKPQIDRRTSERLRKGQMPIDARIDLHGMTKDTAYEALSNFIPKCHSRGHRCILIITGKGARGPLEEEIGTLKKFTPKWLNETPLSRYILKIMPAKPKDGGSGALYVLLRRKRD